MLLQEKLYKILQDDAQLTAVSYLGHADLLGHPLVEPYGVFMHGPPEEPDFPLLAYYSSGQVDVLPRSIYYNFAAWGNNYEAILERVYQLLNNQTALFVDVTDFHVVRLVWNWAGPEVFDPNYRIYTRTHRYEVQGVKL